MIKQDVYDEVQGLEPLCQEICHTLWNHPELSGNERESANYLRKILSEEGFTIENNEHLEHAFLAQYGDCLLYTSVPHAFNPKAFPDFDCPPHFYAHGHNPQFRYFKYFSDYVNRIMDIMKDGHYPAKIGLLYPAEMEWAGNYMPVEKPARVLTQSQIPFDIVTRDYLKQAEITGAKYKINQTEFEVLVVPYGESASYTHLEISGQSLH